MAKLPSPCIDVCKYKISGGYCIACGMTKRQKSKVKKMGGKDREKFVTKLVGQQREIGSARSWQGEYLRKCRKKDVTPPAILREKA